MQVRLLTSRVANVAGELRSQPAKSVIDVSDAEAAALIAAGQAEPADNQASPPEPKQRRGKKK